MILRRGLALIPLLLSVDATAQTQTLSGRWSASTMRTTWTAEPWGNACGPKPNASSEPGGIVTITQQGRELVFSGLGRNFSSSSCWESIPGGRVVGHSGEARAWRTTCQSAPNDSRRSAISTTLSATDDRIDFAETGQFEYSISGEVCHAVMRRSRSFSLVEREGESRAEPNEPTYLVAERANQSNDNAAARNACTSPGQPARIEVSPARKLLRAGEEFTFRVKVLDKGGCTLSTPVTWTREPSEQRLDLSPQGKVTIREDAAEGQAQLSAQCQGQSVSVTVDIVSDARYHELLAAGTFDAQGETKELATTTLVSSTVGAKNAVLEATPQKRRIVFIWTIGALASLLAMAALYMALTRRKTKPVPQVADDDGNGQDEDKVHYRPAPAASPSAWICPTCHEEYPAEQRFCAVDGNRLVEMPAQVSLTGAEGGICPVCRHGFDPGIARCPIHDEELVPSAALLQSPTAAPAVTKKICPVCGTIYGSETQFCGNDGAALVPIN